MKKNKTHLCHPLKNCPITSIRLTPGDLSPKTVPSPSFSPSWWGITCLTFGYRFPYPSVVSPGTFVGSWEWTRVVLVPSLLLVRRVNKPIVSTLEWVISWWEVEWRRSSYQIATGCGSKLFTAVSRQPIIKKVDGQRHHPLCPKSLGFYAMLLLLYTWLPPYPILLSHWGGTPEGEGATYLVHFRFSLSDYVSTLQKSLSSSAEFRNRSRGLITCPQVGGAVMPLTWLDEWVHTGCFEQPRREKCCVGHVEWDMFDLHHSVNEWTS